MKKPIFSKVGLTIFMLFLITSSYSQNFKPFSPRFDSDVKGSMVMLGNNILSKDNNPYNIDSGALSFNENIDMKYIDIDGDPATFSSSSADLIMPNPQCFKIVYAGLYWGALLQTGSRSDINKIKVKIPGGSYQDVTGAVLYDAAVAPIGSNSDKPYACYADITALVQAAANPIGTYTVANITSSLGFNGTTGLAAGWNLVVIYEDPTRSAQSITTFDGFSAVSNGQTVVFKVDGFRSRPAGLVNVVFGIAGLEGDKDEGGSKLEINGKAITTGDRPSNHFFNSTIDNLAGKFTARNPNGSNTLGFDSGIINVPNPGQTVVENNATSAEISLQMAKGQGGTYYSYFNAFAIDIIAPEIVLTKQVQDAQGNDASAANVVLGQNLFYVIGFQNIGNDPATQFTIRDVLPNNIIFNYPADITYLPPGVTATYDAATRSITFSIDKTLVEIGDPRYEIRFKVQVVPTCNQLSSACSNEIKNQAFATYRGLENTLLVTDDPSLPSYTTCNITTAPSATNFLVGVSGCSYGDSQVLCGNNVLLTASNGYASYSWSRDPSGVPVIGTGQTYLATKLGKYYVHNTAAPPCFLNIVEEINVVPFGNTVTNPVIPFADNVVTCPNDGKSLPLIYLCGANATRAIQTNVSDGSTIVWEKLNEASCAAVSNSNCANENSACTWTQVGTGPNYTATAAGQYRMTLNYSGGCFNRFYFNVYQNLLSPTVTKKDIVCNTPGRITVGGVPSGYEYSLSPTGPFQSSNVFDIPTQNLYTVYIRQVGVATNPCLFTVPDIFIRKRNFTVSTVATAPLCNGGKGSLKLAANDVEPQYFYKVSQGGVLINSVGPILASDYTFANLNPGVYDVEVSTQDGCIQAFQATVPDTPLLTATVTLTKPLTCTDGEITVYPVGGTPPYTYFVNNSTNYETSPVIAVPVAGVYTIDVFDANSCTTRVSISVVGIPPPTFDVVKTDLSCSYVAGDGTISLTNIVPNGNTLRYSIDNGVTFLSSPVFTNLTAGNYNVVVEYSTTYATGTSVCKTPPQSITITVPVAIMGTATLTAPYTCLQTATIEAQSVSGGTGVYQYSINGTTFQALPTFAGLTNGTYTITIKDANNCTFVTTPVTISPLTPPTNLDFSATDLTCPSNTSDVTLSATGGFGVQTYQITAPAGLATSYQTSNVFSGLAPGTYTFQVKDAKDCKYQESYSIAPLPTVAVVGQVVGNVPCFGTATGSVRFTVSGSTGFTYTINGIPQGVGASPIDLINQTAGTYIIVITNTATNCTATTSVAIAQPAEALAVTTTVTPIKCTANGSVVVNATGGWGGNTYTLTQPDNTVLGVQTSNTFTNLTQVGPYTARVTDANNCTVTDTFTLSTPIPPTASIDPSSDLCFDGVNAAKIVVSATPGTGTILEYNINGGLFQASTTFANLAPGDYTVIVRDDYGCSVTLPKVTIAPQLAVNTVLTKDLDCNSSPDAVITSTISGGYPDYSYKVSFNSEAYSASVPLRVGVSTIVYNTLIAGTYQFEITDAKGCTIQSAIITVNPIVNPSATLTVIKPSCNGFSDGSVQIVPSGGVGPYTYSFDGSPFTAVSLYPNLKAGIPYAYEVRDSKNCPFMGTVTLTEPTALVVTASATVFKCDATNTKQSATVTIAVPTTGTPPYQYSFDGGANYSTTNILTVNDNGTDQDIFYAVKDANGCTAGGMVTITKFNPPTDITFTQARPITCIDWNSDVTLTMPVANNGVAPFTLENSTTGIQNATGVFTSLTPGTYVFKVTDTNGCFYTESYIVEAVVSITVAGQLIKDVSCNGFSDGAVNFTVSGYAGTYSYSVNGGPLVTGQRTATINLIDLPTGDQKIDITDEVTGCVATATIFVPQPAALTLVLAGNVNANCNFNAQVSVTAGGGTPNYTYAFVQKNVAPVAGDYNNSNSAILNPATNLNWDVWVKDAKGCTTKLDVVISKDDAPTITAPALQCYTGSPLNITVNGTVDPDFTPAEQAMTTYSIGGVYQSSPDFTLNAPGIYTLGIKDKNGCTAETTYEVKPQLLLDANMTQDLTCLVNANIVLTTGGGTGTYPTYEVSFNGDDYASITGSPYTTAVAGNYQFRVTDSQGCQSVSNVIIVTPNTTPTFATAQTNVSCFGGNDGSIVVTASPVDGIAPFQYSKDGGTTFQASNVFAGLIAGTYKVIVKDSKGCDSVSMEVTITQPVILTASSSITTPLTCGAGNAAQPATVTVTGINGAGGYQYSFDGGVNYSATNTYQSYTGITFDVWVKDANGCTYKLVNGVDIPALNPPTDLTFTLPSDTRCTTVQAAVTNGTGVGSLTYEITFPVAAAISNNTGIFPNLAAGTYVFKVTDANGCYYTKSYTVTPIAISGLKIADVKCFGDNDGAIQYTVSNYVGTYTPVLTSGAGTLGATGNTINLTGLVAGNYTMQVTDNNTGCVASIPMVISQPAAGLSITGTAATHVHCNNYNSQITVTASGGTKNYTYAAVIAGTAAPTTFVNSDIIIVNTNSGANLSWDVYVKDIQGCTTMSTVPVILDSMPTVTATITNQCTATGTNFTISAEPGTTGVFPFTYSIDGSNFKSENTFNVPPGTYTVTIKDVNQCTGTVTPVKVYEQLTTTVSTKQLDCRNPPNAVITVTIAGGKAPFNYTYQKGLGTVSTSASTGGTTLTYTVLPADADIYTFVITDANNCTSTISSRIDPIVLPTVTETHVNPLCNTDTNGSVQLEGHGGSGGFTYSKDGITYTPVSLFTGLGYGTYTFYVKDSKECTNTVSASLTQPEKLVATVTEVPFSCSNSNTKVAGTITINAPTGGTPPYVYSFNGATTFTSNDVLTLNDSGSSVPYTYSIKDKNGCVFSGSGTLNQLNPPTIESIIELPILCAPDARTTSTVTVNVTEGTGVGTLQYETISPSPIIVAKQNSNSFNGLTAGTYIFKVTDANGCYITASHIVKPAVKLTVSGTKISDVKCFGDSTGSIQFTTDNNTGTYSHTLKDESGTDISTGETSSNGEKTITYSGLAKGTYTYTVLDAITGCDANSIITITEPNAGLSITSAIATNVHCNNYNSQITVTASGGTKNYTYAVVKSGDPAPVTFGASNILTVNTLSGTVLSWDVYVKDANGCITNNTLSPTMVTLDPMPTVTTTTPLATDQCTSNGSSYSFTASGTGVAPLTYSIGGSFQTIADFTVTATGLYTITVKDGNGCTAKTAITIYPVLTATAVLTKDLDCSASPDATIAINATGGLAGYSYEVSFNGGPFGAPTLPATIVGNIFTTNVAGNYQFEVTDANGCKKVSNPITINPKEDPVITLLDQTQDIYCNGEATASITVTIDASKGIGPFTYSIDGTNFQTSNVFSGLAAGTYTVIVKDSKGCVNVNTKTIDIGQPDALDYTLTKTDMQCSGPPAATTLGSVTVDVGTGLGGTAPYTYILTNNVGDPTQTETNNLGTNHTFTGLNYGTYTVTVIDAKGCTLKMNIPVASPPNDLVVDVQATASCAAGGTVKVTAASGLLGAGPFYFAIYQKDPVSGLYPGEPTFVSGVVQPPYKAEDAPASASATFTGLIQGVIYSFIVYDKATGCSYIKQASAPTIKATSLATLRVVTDVTCKGAGNGTVSITLSKEPTAPSGYSPPTTIDYVVYNSQTNLPIVPANQGSGIPVGAYPYVLPLIGGLSPGSYYVVITEHGGTNDGCSSATLPFDIYESATDLKVTASVVKNANCNANAGQIVAIAQGGTTVSREDPLAEPAQVSVRVPYQYQILLDSEIPPTASDVWGLSNTFMKDNGKYIVYAMDANKCIKSFPITLDLDPSPAITLVVTDKCAVEGAFEIVVNEATARFAPYSISVNGSAYQNFSFVSGTPNSYTISNLNSGGYDISVKDVNGCIGSDRIILYKKVSVNAELTKEFDCTTSPNAIITTTISNGLAPFTYKVNIDGAGYGGSNPVTGTSFTESIIPTATTTTYQFEITDANSCIVETNAITIEPIEKPTATAIITNATCSGTANGSVTIIPSLGVGPYTFSFNGSAFTTDVTYSGLAGTVDGTVYNYQVKDSYGCIFDGTATVFEPTPVAGTIALTQGLTCGSGNATQAATVTVTPTPDSGTSPYYYSFDGGLNYSSNSVYTTNVAGDVSALIKDGNGCVIAAPLIKNVPALNPPTGLGFTSTPVWCAPEANTTSTVTLTAANGIGELFYTILPELPAGVTKSSENQFAGLSPGIYLFQVTDANRCTYQESYEVKSVTNITVSGEVVSNVTCNVSPAVPNGAVKFTVGNFSGTYSYTINSILMGGTAQTAQTINVTDLPPDTYTIIVTDNTTNCTDTFAVSVAQPTSPLSVTPTLVKNANCDFGAKVSVAATGGTLGYKYAFALATGPVPGPNDYTTATNVVLDATLGLNWIAYVIDANGCDAKAPLALVIDPLPTIDLITGVCYTGVPVTIKITGTYIETPTYSIGNGWYADPNFVLNAPATYTLYIKDGNGCIVERDYELKQQLLLQADLTQDLTCEKDASITLLATQGTSPYSKYEVSSDGGLNYTDLTAPVSPFTTNLAGTYKFRVTDTQMCTAESQEIIVTPKTVPTFTTIQHNVSCKDGNDGNILVTAADGILPYTYSINGGAFQTDNFFKNLIAGSYNIVVKDAKACPSEMQIIIISEPSALKATIGATKLLCGTGNATQPSIVTVTVDQTTGTAPYYYSFDGGVNYSSNSVYTTNVAGNVNALIKDGNGCVIAMPLTVNIPALNPPTDLDFSQSAAITCLALTTTVTVSVPVLGNGIAPFTYAMLTTPPPLFSQAGNAFSGLLPGTYLFQVTDDNGCTYQESYEVKPVIPIAITGLKLSDAKCFEDNTGAIQYTVSGYAGTYTGVLTTGTGALVQTDTKVNLTGLVAGDYTVTVTDNITGCEAFSTITVNEPPVGVSIASATATNVHCNNDNSQITVTATGGTPNYTYAVVKNLLPAVTPPPIAGAYSAGNILTVDTNSGVDLIWDVYVKDLNGCTTMTTVTVVLDPMPTVSTPALASNQCMVSNGFTFTATGTGIAPLIYSINGGFSYQDSSTFTVNTPGSYTVTVKDGNGCVAPSPTPTVVYPQLTIVPEVTKELDCSTSPNAEITVTANGGRAPFTYRLQIGAGVYSAPASFVSPFTYSAATAGTYTFEITDANGCSVTNATSVAPITEPTATKTPVDISCNGGSDGSVQIIPAGGSGGYLYSFYGGEFIGTSLYTGLSAGIAYSYQVRDSKGCTSVAYTVTLTEPTALVANATITKPFSCSATNTNQPARITIDIPTTGTAPYQYSFNGSVYTDIRILDVNDNGNDQPISYSVRDAHGCTTTAKIVTLLKLNPPSDLKFDGTPVWCEPVANRTSTVTLITTNGVGTLSYEILSPASATSNVSGASNGIFTGLLPGTYLFQVTDTNGCFYQESHTVDPVKRITVAGQLVNDVTCFGTSTGKVKFTVGNLAGAYTYLMTSGTGVGTITQTGNVIDIVDLPIGTYTIQITDSITGCFADATVVVNQPPVLSLTLNPMINANCNFNAQVSVTASGGTPGYKYAFVQNNVMPVAGDYSNSNSAVLDPGINLNWDVWVMDAKGCTFKHDVEIVKDDVPTITAPGLQCYLGSPLNIAIESTVDPDFTPAEVAATTYSIGGAYQSSPNFTLNAPGIYTLSIKDKNNCVAITTYEVKPQLFVNALLTQDLTCIIDANINLTPSGGTGVNSTYEVSYNGVEYIPATTPFTTALDGTYQFRVTDSQGCQAESNMITVTPKTTPTLTFNQTNISCKGGNNGAIVITGLTGIAPYKYSINGSSPQNSNLFTGLTASAIPYVIQVIDSKNCLSDPVEVTITEPLLALAVSGTATPFACAPDNIKTVSTVTITELAGSGTSPYLYSIDGISYTPTNTFSVIDTGVTQTINISVRDANGCSATNTVNLTPLPTLRSAAVTPVTAIDCNNTGSVGITVGGGSGNFSYQLLPGGIPQSGLSTSNIFNITTPGNYYFQVNDLTTGCSIATSYTVAPFNTIDVVATATTPVTCFGDANGAISINVTGYSGAFNYEVFDNLGSSGVTGSGIAPTTQLISGLSAGNFTVKVTEKMTPFCKETSNVVTVASPALALAVVANETASVTCANNQGTITAIGTGGWGSLQYELVGPINVGYSTSSTFNNLVAGNYTVNVKDAKGCIRSSNLVQLSVPTPIIVTASPNVATVNCNEDTSAVITVNTITGGSGNYLYTLVRTAPDGRVTKNGPQMSDVFNNLGAGTYQVLVSDDWSCSGFSNTIVIAQPTRVTTNLVVAATQTCLTQTRLKLSANGGTPPYAYSTDGISYGATTFNPSVTFPVPVGTYHYYVKDSNNCVGYLSNDITIDPLPPLVINLDKTNAVINCAGDDTGVIVATAQGGLGNYIYTLQDASGNNLTAVQASPGVFTELFAGTYQVKVDSDDCTTTSSIITITQPLAPLAAPYTIKDVTCNGANNGIIEINVSGGTGIIKYAISPYLNQFVNNNIFEGLAPGIYDVIVQDVLGCYVKINFDIIEPAPLTADTAPFSIIPEICFGDKDGAFSIDITGGIAPYNVSLDNPNGIYTTGTLAQTQFDFPGLSGGNHVVYIRDSMGCDIDWTVTLPESIKINPIAVVDYSCVSNSATNTVTVTVDASIKNPADLDYSLDGTPYQVNNVFTNVVPGVNHFIDVRHTNGCIQRTMNFDIAQIDPLAITLNDGGLNEIVVVTTGGSGGNQYTLNGESYGNKSSFIVYESGDYTVEVTDTNGCSATAIRYFEFIDIEIPNVFTPNGDGYNDGWGPSKTINYPDLVFDIYDRYGRKIATYKEGQYWDGKYNSLELPSGDYWYVLKLQNNKDAREFVGHFTLYR